MTTTIIIVMMALIAFVILVGMISAEGNMNTWETLAHIYNERKKRESELKLEIEIERTKQAVEFTKQTIHSEFNKEPSVNYQ